MIQTTKGAGEKHDTPPWGWVECSAPSHSPTEGAVTALSGSSHTGLKEPVYTWAALRSPPLLWWALLRPSGFTAVSVGVTRREWGLHPDRV